jgi:hypothetical protein
MYRMIDFKSRWKKGKSLLIFKVFNPMKDILYCELPRYRFVNITWSKGRRQVRHYENIKGGLAVSKSLDPQLPYSMGSKLHLYDKTNK